MIYGCLCLNRSIFSHGSSWWLDFYKIYGSLRSRITKFDFLFVFINCCWLMGYLSDSVYSIALGLTYVHVKVICKFFTVTFVYGYSFYFSLHSLDLLGHVYPHWYLTNGCVVIWCTTIVWYLTMSYFFEVWSFFLENGLRLWTVFLLCVNLCLVLIAS